ncbi:MAG: alpha-2-macroglobulin family protein [Armatimonadota bacterium]
MNTRTVKTAILIVMAMLLAGAALADAKAPNMQLSVSQRSFFSGKPATLSLSLYNLKSAQLRVYAVPLHTLAPDAAAASSDDPKTKGSLPYRLGHLKFTAPPVKLWTAAVAKPTPDSWEEVEVKAPLLPPGIYVVSATGGGVQKRAWFAVSSRALLLKRSPQEVLAWVVNSATGQPVAGLPVAMFDEKGKAATTATTGEGLVKFPAPPIGTACWVATQKGDPAFALAGSPDYEQPYKAYLYTDRPVYRPGQTVRFRGSVRAVADRQYSLPNSQIETVRAQIKTSGGSTVYDERLPLNEYGSFNGDFALAPEPPLGGYELVVTAGKGALETMFYANFNIEAYRKPEFTVEAKADKPQHLGGEDVEFTISATYFFGSPVSGGKVSYSVEFNSAGSEVPAEVLTAAGLGTAATAQIENSFRGDGRLDKNGQLRLRLKTKSVPFDRYVSVTAEVSETALRPRSASANAYIYSSAYDLNISLDKDTFLPGETANVSVRTTDREGKPVSAAVTLTLIENLVDRESRSYEEKTKKVIETNSEGRAVVPFVVKRLGYHQFTAWAKDPGGNSSYASAHLEVVKKLAPPRWPSLSLRADQDSYAPGGTAVVDVATDQIGAWMLVTVEGSKLFSSKVYRVQAHDFKLSFPIPAEWQPNVEVRAAIVSKGELTTSNTDLRIPIEDKRLTVIVTPNKDKYQPTDTASYVVTTRDSKGAAVAAEVGLGVVDASVYEISPDSTQSAFSAWWGERANRVQTNFSWVNAYPRSEYFMMPVPSPVMAEMGKGGAGGGADREEEPRVRQFFTDTAYWGPSVVTGPDGSAEVKFTIPDNLTTWRATARGMTKVTQAGEARKDVVVTMPLLVRLTLPRFYVQGDEATAAATVHNYTGTERTVKVSLTCEGVELLEPAEKTIKLANDGLQRLTWKIKVTGDKSARFLVSADGGPGGKDAMESTLPVQPDGVKDVVAAAGMIATQETTTLNLPASAVPGSANVEVSLSPSLAGPIFDALEYLTTYPYGCAEQTMDGFLPDLIVVNTLQKLGAQRPRPKMLDRYVSFGLQKLLRFQHEDGGWHWWEFDESDPFITAYVVYGLKMASDAGYVAAHDAMVKGTVYLREALQEEQFRDAQAYLLWAAAYAGVWDEESLTQAQSIGRDLYEQREKLDYFSRASLSLALTALSNSVKAEDAAGLRAQAKTLAAELDKEAKPQGVGAYWAADGRYKYSWLDNNVEVTSQVLSALLTLKPDSKNIVPAVRWLMAARNGKQWSSTKDTAAAVLVLTKYLEQSKELTPSYTARVFSGDKLIKEIKFEAKDAFADAVKVNVPALDLKAGDNAIRIEKTGAGNVYWAAWLSYLQPSARVVPVAKGIEVERKYRVPAVDPSAAGTLETGSVVYVDVTIRNAENLRYALLQEPIPAGCEVIEGERTYLREIGLDRREVWDNKLVLYFDYLPRGERTFTYVLRTEAPGNYRILPTSAELMYFPEVRGNGKPVRVKVAEAE